MFLEKVMEVYVISTKRKSTPKGIHGVGITKLVCNLIIGLVDDWWGLIEDQ